MTQAMQQAIHHVITDKRPRRLRHRRRNAFAPQGGHDRFDRQRAEVRRRASGYDRHVDRLQAFIVRDPRIIDVDRHPFNGDVDATARLANRQR